MTSPALGELLAQVVIDEPGELFLLGLANLLDGLAVRLSRLA